MSDLLLSNASLPLPEAFPSADAAKKSRQAERSTTSKAKSESFSQHLSRASEAGSKRGQAQRNQPVQRAPERPAPSRPRSKPSSAQPQQNSQPRPRAAQAETAERSNGPVRQPKSPVKRAAKNSASEEAAAAQQATNAKEVKRQRPSAGNDQLASQIESLLGRGTEAMDKAPILALLTGRVERLVPNEIPDMVSSNQFIRRAMSTEEVSKFLSSPVSVGMLLTDLGVEEEVTTEAVSMGMDLEQMIAPGTLFDSIGVDKQRVGAELSMLKDNIRMKDGLSGYMLRAAKLRAQLGSAGPRVDQVEPLSPERDEMQAPVMTDGNWQLKPQKSVAARPQPRSFQNVTQEPSFRNAAVPSSSVETNGLQDNLGAQPSFNPVSEGSNAELTAGFAMSRPTSTAAARPSISVGTQPQMAPDAGPAAQVQQSSSEAVNRDPRAASDAMPLSGDRISKDPYVSLSQTLPIADAKPKSWTAPRAALAQAASTLGISVEEAADALSRWRPPGLMDGGQPNPLSGSFKPSLQSIDPRLQVQLANVDALEASPQQQLPVTEYVAPSEEVPTGAFSLGTSPAGLDVNQQAAMSRPAAQPMTVEMLGERLASPASFSQQQGQGQSFSQGSSGESSSFEQGSGASSQQAALGAASPASAAVRSANEVRFEKLVQESESSATQEIVKRAQMLIKEGGGSVRIELGSKELGPLDLAVRLRDQDVEIKILASSDQVKEMVSQSMASLKDSLANQNLRLTDFEVGARSEQGWQNQFADGSFEQGSYSRSSDEHETPRYVSQTQQSRYQETRAIPHRQMMSQGSHQGQIQVLA